MQIAKNFHLKEFVCNCGKCHLSETKIDGQLVKKLQVLRDKLGKPMKITSGYRCEFHNRSVGGAKASYHLKGKAVDILASDRRDRVNLIKWALEIGLTVGLGDGFLHFDNRKYQTVFDY